MLICDYAETVVVPFPFVDAPVSKRRPAVVISSRDFNHLNGHSVLAMITTAGKSLWPSDHRLLELAAAGLSHSSVIRMKLFTLPNGLIIRQLGLLSQRDQNGLSAALASTVPIRPYR